MVVYAVAGVFFHPEPAHVGRDMLHDATLSEAGPNLLLERRRKIAQSKLAALVEIEKTEVGELSLFAGI